MIFDSKISRNYLRNDEGMLGDASNSVARLFELIWCITLRVTCQNTNH